MIELELRGRRCLLFGTGLVGSSIWRAFSRAGWSTAHMSKDAWADPLQQSREVRDYCKPHHDHIVWAAGRAGFCSDTSAANRELRAFESATAALKDACGVATSFDFISSAGGLFEGSRSVSKGDTPAPLRPYGQLKLDQESVSIATFDSVRIHRVSSAYGTRSPGMRRSLISELIENTIRQDTTTISGLPETQRDFVYAEDIGRFVARSVADRTKGGVHHLVSGRPTAIGEAVALAHRICGRPPLVRYTPPTNDAPITFSPSLRSERFQPTEVSMAMHAMARFSRGAGAPLP